MATNKVQRFKCKFYKPTNLVIDKNVWTYEITTSMYRAANNTAPKIEYYKCRYKYKLLYASVLDIAIFKNLHFFYTALNGKPYIAIFIYPKDIKYKK